MFRRAELGEREAMNSQHVGSSFRAAQTTEATKLVSVDSTLKEVNNMATEQKRNEKLHAPNMTCAAA